MTTSQTEKKVFLHGSLTKCSIEEKEKIFGSFSFAVKTNGGTSVVEGDGKDIDVRSVATFRGTDSDETTRMKNK